MIEIETGEGTKAAGRRSQCALTSPSRGLAKFAVWAFFVIMQSILHVLVGLAADAVAACILIGSIICHV